MKHIAVHSKEKVKTGELTQVWEVITHFNVTGEFKAIKITNHSDFIFSETLDCLTYYMVVFKSKEKWDKRDYYVVVDKVENEKVAYEPHKNKFLNWINKLNGVKVRVVGIESKQIKNATNQDGLNAGYENWRGYNAEMWLSDNLTKTMWGEPSISYDTHCIIYKLQVI